MRTVTSRSLAAVVVLLALLAAGCGGAAGTPEQRLLASLRRTADTPLRWELRAEVDDALLAEIDDPVAARILPTLTLSGVRAQGTFQLVLGAAGLDFFQLRSLDEGRDGYVRISILQAARVFAGEDLSADELLGSSGLGQLPSELEELFRALFEGRWLGFVDVDQEALAAKQAEVFEDLYGDSAPPGFDISGFQEAGRQMGEALLAMIEDPEAAVERYTDISTSADGDATVYEVRLLTEPVVRDAAAAVRPYVEELAALGSDGITDEEWDQGVEDLLAEAPTSFQGFSVRVEDGYVTQIVLDVGELIAGLPDVDPADVPFGPDQLRIVLELSEHGEAAPVEAPDDALVYTQEDLEGLIELFADPATFGAMTGPSLDSGSGYGSTDDEAARSEVRNLAVAEEVWFTDHGTYTDDLAALAEQAGFVGTPWLLRGACVTPDGQDFAVGASAGGGAWFLSASGGQLTTDVTSLPCAPAFEKPAVASAA